MNKFLTFCCVALAAISLSIGDADAARRLGGGKSLGKQREMQQAEPQRPAPAPQSAPQAAPQPAPQGAPAAGSRWLGPLAGLAAGGLFAALLFGGAFDGIKLMDILVLAALAGALFFVLRALRRPQPLQYAGGPGGAVAAELPPSGAASSAGATRALPAGFDAAPFLRNARTAFIRLQQANDTADLDEMRDYTAPELFEELRRELAGRAQPQRLKVESLDAELLEVVTESGVATASVRFSGALKEAASGETETFDEIWHVEKNLADPKSVWLLAGIQQAH